MADPAALSSNNRVERVLCRVCGGRASVHTSLYGHGDHHTPNSVIHNFHTCLCRQGKPGKVALVAAMRKLLIVLNAVMRDQVPWQREPVTKPIHT